MASNTPKKKCVMAIQKPEKMTQTILNGRDRQPGTSLLLLIWRPKGNNINAASLKHCSPNGIPTIEMQRARPEIAYSSAVANPPNISHIILPNNLIPGERYFLGFIVGLNAAFGLSAG